MLAACHGGEPSTAPDDAPPSVNDSAPAIDPEQGSPIEPFLGEFTYAGGDTQRQAAVAALDGALDDLDPISRSLARRKLAKQDPAIPQITIGFSNGETSIARLDSIVRAPLGGGPVTVSRNGKEAKVTHELQSPLQLVETLQGPRGRTVSTFVLGDDGDDLTVTTLIEGERLSAPVVYHLSYRRR